MKLRLSVLLGSATILLILFSISNIVLSFISLNTPMPSGEFNAMHNVAMGLYCLLILIFSITMAVTGFFILKFKKWAYFLNLILLFFTMLLLEVSDFKELAIQWSLGSKISITKEIFPILILIMLILNFRCFWFKKKATHE